MSNWSNEEPLNLRTRLAVRLLLLATKILSPYEFQHKFEAEFKEINELISQTPEQPKSEKPNKKVGV